MNEKQRKSMRIGRQPKTEARDKQTTQAKKSIAGRQRKQAGTEARFDKFSTIYEKQNRQLMIPDEWNYLITLLINGNISEETCFQACVSAYIYGLVWQEYQGMPRIRSDSMQNLKDKQNPMRPELQKQIEEIIEINEKRNGDLKKHKKVRGLQQEPDAPVKRLDRCEMKDFMNFLHQHRQDIQPGRVWRETMCQFFSEQANNLPVFEACMECFRAGVIWQMNRRKLEK